MAAIDRLRKAFKQPVLIKGGKGRKSDEVIELSDAKRLESAGEIEPVGIEREIETNLGRIRAVIFRKARLKRIQFRGLSARMSPPHPSAGGRAEESGYVRFLDAMATAKGDAKSRAESILQGWKKA